MGTITYICNMSRTYVTCHVHMEHVTYMNGYMSHGNMSRLSAWYYPSSIYNHIYMNYVTYMNGYMSHGTGHHPSTEIMGSVMHINESCLTRMSHVTNVWVMSHVKEPPHTHTVHHTHTPYARETLSSDWHDGYGVALVSRIDTIIGLFCKRDL